MKEAFPIGSGIEDDGQDAGWIKTGRGCIDHELSHGNTHAIGAPVPNTEDGFRVRDDNKVNVTAFRGISDCRFHLFWMDNGKIGRVFAALQKFTVSADAFSNARIIDNGHEFRNMLFKDTEEQGPITAEYIHQIMPFSVTFGLFSTLAYT